MRHARTPPYPRWTWMLVTYLFIIMLTGSTLPTPLYPLYTQQLGLSTFTVTVIFAVYALGVLITLLTCGRLSDQLGRKVVLMPGLLLGAVSGFVLMTADSLPSLLLGRIISGMSVGLIVGAAAAYLVELHPNKNQAALVATLANMLGLGLGALLSGFFAERSAAPTVLPYGVFLGLLAPGALLVLLPETVVRKPSSNLGYLQVRRPYVPQPIRLQFFAAAIAAFAAYAFLGLFSALSGRLLADGMQQESPQLIGLITFAAFGAGAVAQLFAMNSPTRLIMVLGLLALPVALGLVIGSLLIGSLELFWVGTVLGGAGAGMAFKAALTLVSTVAPPDRRAEVTSAFFLASYLGLTAPVLGLGALLAVVSLVVAATVFALLIALLALAGIAVAYRSIPKCRPGPSGSAP